MQEGGYIHLSGEETTLLCISVAVRNKNDLLGWNK